MHIYVMEIQKYTGFFSVQSLKLDFALSHVALSRG